MPIVDSLLPEFDHEVATTRRLLERVPEAEFGWKPHDKSYTLGQLAGHVANILTFWCYETLNAPYYDVASKPQGGYIGLPTSSAELMKHFDDGVAKSRAKLAGASDAEMMAPWTLKNGEHEVFSIPRVAALRSFVMNHMIHHRGQLSVYLRLKNIPLPPIYGPSADEQ